MQDVVVPCLTQDHSPGSSVPGSSHAVQPGGAIYAPLAALAFAEIKLS